MSHRSAVSNSEDYTYGREQNERRTDISLRSNFSGHSNNMGEVYRISSRGEDEVGGRRGSIEHSSRESVGGYSYPPPSSRSLYRSPNHASIQRSQQLSSSSIDRPYPPPSWNTHRRIEEFTVYRSRQGPNDLYDYPPPPQNSRLQGRNSTGSGIEEGGYHHRRPPKPEHVAHNSNGKDIHMDPSSKGSFRPPEYRRDMVWSKEHDDYPLAMKEAKEAYRLSRREPTSTTSQQPQSQYPFPYDPDFPSVNESEVSSAGDSLGLGEDGHHVFLSSQRYQQQRRRSSNASNYRHHRWVSPEEDEATPYTYTTSDDHYHDPPPRSPHHHHHTATPREVCFESEYSYPPEQEPPRRRSPPTIEVSPGEFMRLRGADETWRAIRNDFYTPCECICCQNTIFCIQDAKLVLCPDCRVVSPIEGNCSEDGNCGGVGLGFRMSDLAQWQGELVDKIHHENGDGEERR